MSRPEADRSEANVTQSKIEFPALNATIQAIGSDFAGAAGGQRVR